MTIFHILKYPLSNPPSNSELEELPKAILNAIYTNPKTYVWRNKHKFRGYIQELLLEFEDSDDDIPRT